MYPCRPARVVLAGLLLAITSLPARSQAPAPGPSPANETLTREELAQFLALHAGEPAPDRP